MDIQDVFKKLNVIEVNTLNKHINNRIATAIYKNAAELQKAAEETEQQYKDKMERDWDMIADRLYEIMRKNRISGKRIKKIFNELVGEHNGND